MDSTARVQVVSHDIVLADALAGTLSREGYEVSIDVGADRRRRGQAAPVPPLRADHTAARWRPDVILVDWRMYEVVDVLELGSRLRSGHDCSLVFVAGSPRLADCLAAFRCGADDYVREDVALPELLARVEARARRGAEQRRQRLRFADLVLDQEMHTVERAGESIDLSRREFDLLEALLRRPGTVFSKRQLLDDVWESAIYDDNVVEVCVSNVRRKLRAKGPHLIHTVRGVGYTLRD